MEFKDHFSGHAKTYSQHRPTYPNELYDSICSNVAEFDLAWDCGTGNGQVAVHLAERFKKVMASDASAQQIEHATPHSKVEYHICKAEQTNFKSQIFDLITVGQAIHWFEFESFFEEVRRVIKPGGIFACWTYRFLTINEDLDTILEKFFKEIEPYWPPERDHVEALYTTIPFPDDFNSLNIEEIHIDREIGVDDVLNYLRTWSSVKNYRLRHQMDPLKLIESEFRQSWGVVGELKMVRHPMLTKLFQVHGD